MSLTLDNSPHQEGAEEFWDAIRDLRLYLRAIRLHGMEGATDHIFYDVDPIRILGRGLKNLTAQYVFSELPHSAQDLEGNAKGYNQSRIFYPFGLSASSTDSQG